MNDVDDVTGTEWKGEAVAHPPGRLRVTRSAITWRSSTATPGGYVRVEVNGVSLWSALLPASDAGALRRLSWPAALLPHLAGAGAMEVRGPGPSLALLAAGRFRLHSDASTTLPHLAATGNGIDKWGELKPHFTAEARIVLLELASRIVATLKQAGFRTGITGGSLLGAIRGGSIIDGDDDIDLVAFIGRAAPVDVSVQSYRIQRAIEESGFTVRRHSDAHIQVALPSPPLGTSTHVDVFIGFFSRGIYSQPVHVRATISETAIVPFRPISLEGRSFPTVADPEAWVAACYGPTWREPDPEFRFETPAPTRRRFESWFGTYDFTRGYWDRVGHSERRGIPGDARRVLRRSSEDAAILDLGCGSGTTASRLARAGRTVRAVDFSTRALHAARNQGRGAFDVSEVNLADRRATLILTGDAIRDGMQTVLLSNVLAFLTRDARSNVFLLLRGVLGSEGVAVASFPIDPSPAYRHELPETWHLPVDWLRAEAAPFGLTVRTVGRFRRSTPDGRRRFLRVEIRPSGRTRGARP